MRKLESKSRVTPPTRNDGSRPAWWSTNPIIALVVVLPCVPATTTPCRGPMKSSPSAWGKETCGSPRSRMAAASGFTARTTLPTTTTSGLARSRFSGR